MFAIGITCTAPSSAQALIHRYSFNGNAKDSVGTADGTVVGSVTLATAPGVNGAAIFPGGTSSTSPSYIQLPTSSVSALQNATVEVFTTNFAVPKDVQGQPGGKFQALFAAGTSYGNLTNYAILCPNRDGAGIGIGTRANNAAETVVTSHDPLPAMYGNHVVDLVFSGFSTVGSTGVETIYLDGVQVAQGATVNSFARVAAGTGGITTVGIGGGSPFNDPTFIGAMCEVRIFDGSLTASQIAANVNAGPAVLGYTPRYTVAEAARALQIAAGLGGASSSSEIARLNVEGTGTTVDVLDALRIARRAMGLDANPQ